MKQNADSKLRWRRWAVAMGFSLAGLAALSWIRLLYVGTPALDDLPLDLPWEIFRRSSFFVLMTTVGVSFLKLYRMEIREDDFHRLLVASLILQAVAAISLPLTSNDIFANLAYGKMSRLGIDANVVGAAALPVSDLFRQMTSARWLNMPIPYGPVIGIMNFIATDPLSLWGSIIRYKLIALALSFGTTWLLWLCCRRNYSGCDRARAFVFVAFNPVFLWEFASQAHNDIVMLAGIAAFMLFLAMRMNWAALACIAFAAAAKLSALPVMAFFLCWTFFSSKRRFAAMSLLLAAGAVAVAGGLAGKIGIVLAPPTQGGIDISRLTGTPLYLVHRILSAVRPGSEILGYRIFWMAANAAMLFVGARFAWRTRGVEDIYRHSALFILGFNFIASPMYQPWYVAWTLPLAMATTDEGLKKFIAIWSVLSMSQYAILNSLSGAIINACIVAGMLIFRWVDVRSRFFEKP